MPVEWHRDADDKLVEIAGGIRFPLDKLLCPECLTVHQETSIHAPADPRLEWSATCPVGHTWRFYI